VPALRTEITEIITGLGMFGFSDLVHALSIRPTAFQNVDEEAYDRLLGAYRVGSHSTEFHTAWVNGVRFARSVEGLRGRPPWVVEWKGAHRPPGYEQIPADLRVDHVFLISCKYGSNILMNSSPGNLFDGSAAPDQDWFEETAGAAYQDLYELCRPLVSGVALPAKVADLTRPDRVALKRQLPRRLQGDARGAYRAFTAEVARVSSARWQAAVPSKRAQEEMVWRLLRLQSAPYFVLGRSVAGEPLAYRVKTPWDLRASHRFVSFRQWAVADRGQPIVAFEAEFRDHDSGTLQTVAGHVEVRWSHGKFAQAPEAKVYLDTPHHEVPAYVPLEAARDDLTLFPG
jgi:hypothetical protein